MRNLTKCQKEVIEMLRSGLSEDDIADKLWIDLESVKKCLYRIRKRLNVKKMDEVWRLLND